MSLLATKNLLQNRDATGSSAADLNDRLAEAARYAVLNRLLPVLRHDVAGAMQPIRMLLMVLEKRLQAADPDLQTIAKNVTSISTLSQQATTSCLGALGWVASNDDTCVNLHSSIDQAISLLAMDLSGNALTLVNGVTDVAVLASQKILRSVFMGAVLAFCDQHIGGGALRVTYTPASASSNLAGTLQLHMVAKAAADGAAPPGAVRKYRLIDWTDVQAMAQSCGVQMALGDGWITLELPTSI